MLDTTLTLGVNFLVIVALLAVHETGHYLAGRFVGIPSDRLSIKLFTLPPHVALIDDDGTTIPPMEYDRFAAIEARYVDSDRERYLFLAGGHGIEFSAVLAVVAVAIGSGLDPLVTLATTAVWFSLLLSVIYVVVFDAIPSLVSGYPHGDFSAQWTFAPLVTIGFYLAYFGGLAFLLVLLPNGL